MRSSAINSPTIRKPAYNNGYLLAAIVVLLLGMALGTPRVRQFPAYIHAWAQADRYALAIGFTENGHDLFHPQTMIYNKQFPHKWTVDNGSTVTAVDFPLHEYVIGWLMCLFGTTAPWVFRGFTLLVSLVGLWLLFLLARRLTGDFFKALLVTVVALTSPLYVYYFNNYLPSAPSLTLSIAALWAYIKYYKEGRRGCWHIAIALVALATLIRSSQAILLIALCVFEVLRILWRWKKERGNMRAEVSKLLSPLLAAVAVVGYMLWNGHLREAYGSLFLNYLMPPRSWEDVRTVFDEIHWHWRFDYFSRLQHWIVAVVCVAAVVVLIARKRGGEELSLGWLAGIWWLGEVCFFVAMFRQYQNHDYYFLDTFFLPILLTFVLALRALPPVKGHLPMLVAAVLLVLLGGVMYNEARHKVADRCWDGDRAYICAQHFADADRWLDDVGIPRDAKLLAFLAYPQNSPFIQMQRKGYTLMMYDENIVNAVRKFPFDYIVVENEVWAQFLDEHPEDEFCRTTERVADNGTLSLLLYHTDVNP